MSVLGKPTLVRIDEFVRYIFSSYQHIHVYTDLYSLLSSLKLQFWKFLQLQISYHRFNGQEQERFYGKTKRLLKSELTCSICQVNRYNPDKIDNLRPNLKVVFQIPAKSSDYQYLLIISAYRWTIIEHYRVILSNRLVSGDRFLSICNVLDQGNARGKLACQIC